MISYEKITGFNKGKEGVKCMICHYYYFKNKFDYQAYVCNECHDFSMTVMNLSDFFVLTIKNSKFIILILMKKKLLILKKNSKFGDKGVL